MEKRKKPELVDAEELAKSLLKGMRTQKLLKIPAAKRIFKGKVEETAVLVISDAHFGKVNYWPNEITGKGEQTYNTEIACATAERLINALRTVNELLSHAYDIKKLYVFCIGDIVTHQEVFRGQKLYIDVGIGGQLMTAHQVFEELLLEFLKMYPEVDATFLGGNHGKLSGRRKEQVPFYNNFDYLLGHLLKLSFRGEKRIKIMTPESWFFTREIYGWKYFLHHGSTVWSWMSFPFYGLVRQGRRRRTEMDIDVEIIGHFHQHQIVPISATSVTFVNGCWIPKDDFAWEQYGFITRPEQLYFGVSPKRPKSWLFNLEIGEKNKK